MQNVLGSISQHVINASDRKHKKRFELCETVNHFLVDGLHQPLDLTKLFQGITYTVDFNYLWTVKITLSYPN